LTPLFKALDIHIYRETEERNASVVGAFPPVSVFVYGEAPQQFKNLSMPLRNTRPLDAHQTTK